MWPRAAQRPHPQVFSENSDYPPGNIQSCENHSVITWNIQFCDWNILYINYHNPTLFYAVHYNMNNYSLYIKLYYILLLYKSMITMIIIYKSINYTNYTPPLFPTCEEFRRRNCKPETFLWRGTRSTRNRGCLTTNIRIWPLKIWIPIYICVCTVHISNWKHTHPKTTCRDEKHKEQGVHKDLE